VVVLLVGLSVASAVRLDMWGKPAVEFAQASIAMDANSARAWAMLCEGYHERSGGDTAHPDFARAVDACEQGSQPAHGITNLANTVVLKSELGTVTDEDWNRLLQRAPNVAMNPDNVGAVWYLVKHTHQDPRINERNTVHLVDAVAERASFDPMQLLSLAYFMSGKPSLQDDAYRYYAMAIAALPANSPLTVQVMADIEAQGKSEWVESLKSDASGGILPAARD